MSRGMAQLAKKEHVRAARMLGYTLTLGDYAAWAGFITFLMIRLTRQERAALAFAALRSLPTDDRKAAAEAAAFDE